MKSAILPFLRSDTGFKDNGTYLEFPIDQPTDGLQANAYYFDNPEWPKNT